MASTLIVHIIGTGALIALMIVGLIYTSTLSVVMINDNSHVVLKYIAESVAGEIARLLSSGDNLSLTYLNQPLEAYSRAGYEVYVGKGSVLADRFPAIVDVLRSDPRAADYIFVVASLPGKNIYEYIIAAKPEAFTRYTGIDVASGTFKKLFSENGYPVAEAYEEDGVRWVCRARINISEKSGTNLYDYPVKLVFTNLSNLSCTWKGRSFIPKYEDIRFMSQDLKPLNYYIEEYNGTAAAIWVKVPYIPASRNVTIYMYWGTLQQVQYRGDPKKVFTAYYDFPIEQWYPDWLSEMGDYVSACNVTSNITGLFINATYNPKASEEKRWNTSYCNLVYGDTVNISVNSQGAILEALGAPRTTGDQDFRIGLYDKSSRRTSVIIFVKPVVVEPVESIEDFTIIWGNATIVQYQIPDLEAADNVLLIYGNETLKYSQQTSYQGGLVLTNNSALGRVDPGKEAFQLLVRVKPVSYDTSTIYAVVFVPEHSAVHTPYPWGQGGTERGVAVGFKLERGSGRWLVTPCEWVGDLTNTPFNPSSWKCRASISIPDENDEPGWVYLYIKGRSPGTSLGDISYSIYMNTSSGFRTVVENLNVDLTGGNIRINYVGFLVVDPHENSTGLFDMLLSGRYSRDEPLPDYRYLYVEGVPGESIVEVCDLTYDGTVLFSVSNITRGGYATLDVRERPVLGLLGLVYFNVTLPNGRSFIVLYDPRENDNQYITGGSVIRLYLGAGPIDLYKAIELRASQKILGETTQYSNWSVIVLSQPLSTPIWYRIKSSYNTAAIYYVGLGLFRNSAYIFVNSTTPLNTTGINTTGSWFPVIGVADGLTGAQTTAFYKWVRLRPFVYPEPTGSIVLVENMKEDLPPVLEYTVQPVIVFSSSHLVDLSLVITSEAGNQRAIVVLVIRGVRGP